MAVQIIITGDYATDALTELRQLAAALIGQTQLAPVGYEVDDEPTDNPEEAVKEENVAASKAEFVEDKAKNPIDEIEVLPPKRLSRVQHIEEADKMIAAGQIDHALYPMLNKVQQKRVSEALLKSNITEPQAEAPLFEAEPEFEEEIEVAEDEALIKNQTVSYDDIRALIKKNCQDADGKDDPKKYAVVSQIIKGFVASNQEPKISNIPLEKLQEIYYAISVI